MFRLKYFVNNIDILGTFLKTLIFINMKNEFIQPEERERKFIRWYIDSNPTHKEFEITPIGSMKHYDFIMTSGSCYVMAEVKVRKVDHNHYDSIYLSFPKLQYLCNEFINIRMNKSVLYYYSVHPSSRTCLVFDLLNTNHKVEYNYVDRITCRPKDGKTWQPYHTYLVKDAIQVINF